MRHAKSQFEPEFAKEIKQIVKGYSAVKIKRTQESVSKSTIQ